MFWTCFISFSLSKLYIRKKSSCTSSFGSLIKPPFVIVCEILAVGYLMACQLTMKTDVNDDDIYDDDDDDGNNDVDSDSCNVEKIPP